MFHNESPLFFPDFLKNSKFPVFFFRFENGFSNSTIFPDAGHPVLFMSLLESVDLSFCEVSQIGHRSNKKQVR